MRLAKNAKVRDSCVPELGKERRCGMSKHDISKGVPITDIRVLPITLKLVERFCEALKRCKNNPDYLLTKTYTKTTM